MIEYTTQDVIRYLIDERKMTMQDAMKLLYMSGTFQKLEDTRTGLYLEGSAYIYNMLEREMNW